MTGFQARFGIAIGICLCALACGRTESPTAPTSNPSPALGPLGTVSNPINPVSDGSNTRRAADSCHRCRIRDCKRVIHGRGGRQLQRANQR